MAVRKRKRSKPIRVNVTQLNKTISDFIKEFRKLKAAGLLKTRSK